MLYLNKLLKKIKENPNFFKEEQVVMSMGLSLTHIKNLKKYALENQLITVTKQKYFLTIEGENFLSGCAKENWLDNNYLKRPDVNVEYLKEETTPSILTKAIRNLAKHMLEGQEIKQNSLEGALLNDIKKCNSLLSELELYVLNGKRNLLFEIFQNYNKKGITKSLFSIILLKILVQNIDSIAIYEKSQFQLKFDVLMFDRMIACPQNFEIQKTEMLDEYLLKDISKIILNKTSYNILEITKGLYKTIKGLDKYTMNTQNLTPKTLRLRNVILSAKDPISLFERDIPKVLSGKLLKDCGREFLNDLKVSLNELKDCTNNLNKDLKNFIFKSFNTASKEDLSERFLLVEEFIGEKELKVLFNSIVDINVSDELWTNRIATFINKSRVPKDWTDEDYADFKVKTKELAVKFVVLESTVGNPSGVLSPRYNEVLDAYLNLSKAEQFILLRNVVNM